MKSSLIVCLLILSACVQNSSYEDEMRATYQPFIGQPLSALITAKGEAPVSSFETDAGRTFIFDRTWNYYIPPTQTSGGYYNNPAIGQAANNLTGAFIPSGGGTGRCNQVVETQQKGKASKPSDFIITSITTKGGCRL